MSTLSLSVFAQSKSIDVKAPFPVDPNVKVGKLENGLIYYIRKNSKPEKRVELRLAINAGSILESDAQQGLAHFTEHMCFNGTKTFPKNELVNFLQKTGVKFGADINAYTSFDETVYMLQIPDDKEGLLEKGLQVIEDWAHNVTFDSKEIDKERGVITEEWRLGLGAEDRMQKKYFPVIFKDSRYALRSPIGKIEVIQNFKHDTLRSFYKDWYRPNLQAVVVVGDINPEEIEKMIIKHFSEIKNPENPRVRPDFDLPANKTPLVSIVSDKEAMNSSIMVFYKQPAKKLQIIEDYKSKVMNELYSGMLNARLDEISKKSDAPFSAAFNEYSGFLARSADAYMLYAAPKENQILPALQNVLTESERVKRFGFLASELERQKDQMLSDYEKNAKEFDKTESVNFAGEYVSNFLHQDPIPGIKNEFKYVKKFLPEITIEDINKLSAKWITDENRVVVITSPEKPNIIIPTEAQTLNVFDVVSKLQLTPYVDTYKPAPLIETELNGSPVQSKKDLAEPNATEITLKNGIKVVVKTTDFKNDEILFSGYSFGGNSLYPDNDFMSATFATQIIDQCGLGNFNQTNLEKKLKGKKIEITPYIDAIKEGITGNTNPKDFETMLQLNYLYFKGARKDTAAFNGFLSNTKNQLKFLTGNPMYAFFDTLFKVSASNSPRIMVIPSEKDLNKIDYDRAFSIYQDRFADASDFKFFVVGNVAIDTLQPMLEKYLGSLPVTNRKETFKDVAPKFPDGVNDFKFIKGTEQKSMVGIIFKDKFEWSDKNKLVLRMLDEVISIKLIEVIREEMSGVYSPQIQTDYKLYPKSEFNMFIMFGCSPKNTEKLTKAVMKIIESIQKKGPTQVDLDKVKELLTREHETGLKTNKYWLSKIESIYFNNESFSSITNFSKNLANITIDDLKVAAQQYLKKDHYVRGVLMPEKTAKK
ncbi:MAG: insulinase family protein [Bacteroidota bacterium]